MEQEENKKKILLVDDEPINHKIVQFLMKAEAEYEILGADGGRQALEILKEQKVDLVLLDIEMPDMNGKEVLSKIRECYEIPVAFVTAGEKADEEEEELLKADGYLTKPFLPEELKGLIGRLLGKAFV